MLSSNKILNIDSPSNTTISINFNGREFVEIDLVQAIEYQITENRMPIYGFGNQNYHSVLSGKRIANGKIVIKKSSQEAILNTIYNDNEEKLKDGIKNKILTKIDIIYELFDNKIDEIRMASAGANINEITEDYLLQQKNKFAPELVMEEISNRINSIKQLKHKNFTDLLSFGDEYPIRLKIESDVSTVIIEDVRFISKTNITDIHQEDIDDIYEFIGNVEIIKR